MTLATDTIKPHFLKPNVPVAEPCPSFLTPQDNATAGNLFARGSADCEFRIIRYSDPGREHSDIHRDIVIWDVDDRAGEISKGAGIYAKRIAALRHSGHVFCTCSSSRISCIRGRKSADQNEMRILSLRA